MITSFLLFGVSILSWSLDELFSLLEEVSWLEFDVTNVSDSDEVDIGGLLDELELLDSWISISS